jgi:serine/threonine protein phosphatase PrpC
MKKEEWRIAEVESSHLEVDNCGASAKLLDQNGNFIGPVRVWRKYEQVPGLMMSRSFGDRYGHSCGVISTPEVINFKLDSSCKAIVLGSDGLWEVMTQ